MNAKRIVPALCAILLLAASAAGAEIARRVRYVEELQDALDTGGTIILASGTYRVPEGAGPLFAIGAGGLVLRGEPGAEVLAESPLEYALSLEECWDVLIEGIAFGHTEQVGCGAGVLLLEDCYGVSIVGCELSGSGTVGLEVRGSQYVSLADSVIYDCTWGAIFASETEALHVEGCDIRDNEAWPLLSFTDCADVSFTDSAFLRNTGDAFVAIEGDGRQILFSDCDIASNAMEQFAADGPAPVLRSVRWSSNEFADGTGSGPAEEQPAEGALEFHHHEGSGLGFVYPARWFLQEGGSEFVGVMEPDEEVGLVIGLLYSLEDSDGSELDADTVTERAIAELNRSAGDADDWVEVDTAVASGGEPGTLARRYRGRASVDGDLRPLALRVVVSRGSVWAVLAIYQTTDAEELHAPVVEAIIDSVAPVGGEE